MTNLAGFRLIYFTQIHSPIVAWIALAALAVALLVAGFMLLGVDEKVANFTAPLRAYLLVRRFPLEEQSRAMAIWQLMTSNHSFENWSLAVTFLRDQQAIGAFKPITSRPPVPTSEIFS